MLDATEVELNLWQGSRPPLGDTLQELGFHLLVLCAEEWQPPQDCFPGVQVLYAPYDDDPWRKPYQQEIRTAFTAARAVARALAEGKKVLVTCWQGWNRSGLVSALAIHLLTGRSGDECCLQVRGKRPGSLSNPGFVDELSSLSAKQNRSKRVGAVALVTEAKSETLLVKTIPFAGKRYCLNTEVEIDLTYGETAVFATHQSLPVSGYGSTKEEAVQDFFECFDLQWRHLVDVPPESLTKQGIKRRDLLASVVGGVDTLT